ncbi:SDR family oxidoreductase [Mesobacillus maritimus]|uniref:SDR family oxidoreductase n=1 Tax=Mesobacillus maritimus TaxID=1643336 RepID=UPI001FE5AE91|nr:SDR family oxidoreductase [Mesobacillus maritimus]
MKKTAIVTGASNGFGLLSVLELAKNDFHVIATMRNLDKGVALLDMAKSLELSSSIQLETLDVTSPESTQELKTVVEKLDSVDVLVNNAGMAIGGTSEELTLEDYRRQFETNFFGVIAVTQAVLPLMRANHRGRIINMSSISGRIGFPGLSPYTASKHALEGYSESLRLELAPFGIDVVLVEPGSYKTNIWSGMDEVELTEKSPYFNYMKTLKNEIERGKSNHGNPVEIAKLVAQIASQPQKPKLRYPIGKGVKANILLKKFLPWKMLESAILKKLQ